MDKKFNAMKHGLLSKQAVINPSESRPFNKLSRKLLAELHPESVLEMMLAEQIVMNYWRLIRYLKLENELFLYIGQSKYGFGQADFINEFTSFVRKNPSFDVLTRYNGMILRSFYKSLHEYQSIKAGKYLNKQEKLLSLIKSRFEKNVN